MHARNNTANSERKKHTWLTLQMTWNNHTLLSLRTVPYFPLQSVEPWKRHFAAPQTQRKNKDCSKYILYWEAQNDGFRRVLNFAKIYPWGLKFFQRSSSFLMIKVLKLYKHSIDGGSNCSKLLFSSLRALHIDGALYFPCFILKLLLQNCRIEKK